MNIGKTYWNSETKAQSYRVSEEPAEKDIET